MKSEHEEVLSEIKRAPHWRLTVRPVPYVAERIPVEDLLSTIGKATVRFRGWDFPHTSTQNPPVTGTNYVQAIERFMSHYEFWKFYSSGQFLYLGAVREMTEPNWRKKLASGVELWAPANVDVNAVPGFFDTVNFVYVVTEFFEFSARLSQSFKETDAVQVQIGLHHIQDFALSVDDYRRMLHGYYAASESSLVHTWTIGLRDLVGSTKEQTEKAIRWFFVRFGWSQPNMEAIRRDIEELTRHG